jgi:hypothetical protein
MGNQLVQTTYTNAQLTELAESICEYGVEDYRADDMCPGSVHLVAKEMTYDEREALLTGLAYNLLALQVASSRLRVAACQVTNDRLSESEWQELLEAIEGCTDAN